MDYLERRRAAYRRRRQRATLLALAVILPLACLLAVGVYRLPFVYDRLAWRLDELKAKIVYALNPPEQAVFTPKEQIDQIVAATLQKLWTSTPAPLPPEAVTVTAEAAVQATAAAAQALLPAEAPTLTPTITPTPTPLPPSASLRGIVHEYQLWNNCGPANLAMALSYWGWNGDQRNTAAYLKPNSRDKNVMPWEMAGFVNEMTALRGIVRYGGDLQMLKALLSAGFPVIIEKGFEGAEFDGWMGHYEVVSAFDDAAARFTVQDSFYGPGLPVAYEKIERQWRAFNYTYIVPYPPEREAELFGILGPQGSETDNLRYAADKAAAETKTLQGRDLYFAWFNRGSSLMYLKDYLNAAVAYDAAFANYPAIPEDERPWRMLWYQTGPYFAYYNTGRYQDVIDLANTTLEAMSEPVLEESYYWRARAKEALGDLEGAIADYRKSVQVHPGFSPPLTELDRLGVEP